MKRPIKMGTIDSGENNRRPFVRGELTNLCNFKCSYCSHASSDIYKNTVIPETSLLLRGAENLAKYQEPIHIDLFGGEATLVPGYLDLLEYLVIKMPNADFDTVSNASKNIEGFKKFVNIFRLDAERISFTFSFHIEQIDLNEYVEKINLLINNGFKVYITFVVFNKMFEQAKQSFYFIKEHSNPTKIYLKYLYDSIESGDVYTSEQVRGIDENNDLENIFKIQFDDGSIDCFNINDLKKNGGMYFKGGTCKRNHNWVITQTGTMRNACKYSKVMTTLTDNLFVNKDITNKFLLKESEVICDTLKCDCIDDFALLKGQPQYF